MSAEEVEVTYKNVKSTPPVLTLREAIKDKGRVLPSGDVTAKKKGENVEKVIKGSMDMFGQYHYTLETLQCICIPTEDGMDVYSSSQWMDNTQIAIAQLLNIPENR